MQHAKQKVLQAVASLPDVFTKRTKQAIGTWAVFGKPEALKALQAMALEDQTAIADQKSMQEARDTVHGFGETLVKMAASTILLPHMFESIGAVLNGVDDNVPAAQVKPWLIDWSDRLGGVMAKKGRRWNNLPWS